jgi:DNA-binding ferritin-like protein
MEIEVITTSAIQCTLDPTRVFGIILNKATSTVKMLHWYVLDHNAHEILGDLYGDLTDLFDKLQEEIIGTSKEYSVVFPSFNINGIQLENIEMYKDNQVIIEYYYNLANLIKDMLTSLEFNNYVTNVKSGINNTKEDILSRINKANYLLSMVKF